MKARPLTMAPTPMLASAPLLRLETGGNEEAKGVTVGIGTALAVPFIVVVFILREGVLADVPLGLIAL